MSLDAYTVEYTYRQIFMYMYIYIWIYILYISDIFVPYVMPLVLVTNLMVDHEPGLDL